MTVRTAMLAPLAIASFVCFAGLFAIGAGAIYIADRTAKTLVVSQKTTDIARQVARTIEETQHYTNEVLSMTRLVSDADARAEFYSRHQSGTTSLAALRDLASDGMLAQKVEALIAAENLWLQQAELVLGFKKADAIPTAWHLENSARRVGQRAADVVRYSQLNATNAVHTAPETIREGVMLIGVLAAFAAMGTLVFASRMSGRISNAMRSVAQSLFELSDLAPDITGKRNSEIRNMFAALNQLRNSVSEKERMASDLAAEKIRAEEAALTKSRFLANMSHEIRTPINGILGMAEILETTSLSSEQQECARTILSSSEALLSVINAILDFSKNEAGEVTLIQEPFSLEKIVYDVALLLGPAIGGKDVEICVDYPTNLPRHFIGDAGRIRQVIMNLVGNAVKFTPSGHVTVSVGYDPNANAPLTICVKDTGVGIPEDKLDAVFMAFQQVDMQATRRFDGTGLGLAITQQLVALFGGEISVTSKLGEGAAFTVALSLPLAKGDIIDPVAPTDRIGLLKGKVVLVVDDLALNRAILQRRLERWDITVHAFSGPTQVRAALAKDHKFASSVDLVILDYHMPDTTGETLAKELRSAEIGLTCPMILYSSSDRSTDMHRLLAQGFSSVLMKPARADVMSEALLTAIAPKSPPRKKKRNDAAEDPDYSGTRILVAEDNRTNRLVVQRMLQNTGATLTFVENGALALEHYQSEGADLILMDMSMPVMDGLTATKHIRSFECQTASGPVPIIALTANALEEDRDACMAVGMTGFLSKPVRKAEVLSQLRDNCLPKRQLSPRLITD